MDENKRTVSADPPPGRNPQSQKHSHVGWWIIGVLVLLLAAIAFLTHRHSAGQAAPKGRGGANAPITVGTVTAQSGSMNEYVEALGTVTPVYTVSVEARVAGQITQVEYQEGEHVKVGDPLVEIDPRPYQAALLQAQGQLEHDKALMADANLDLARYKDAYESNAIPKQQYDTQVATVQQDEGTVKVDQGNLDNANVNLAYAHITSPIDGRVGLRLVDPGNIVQANGTTPLVVIAQTRPITVIFTVAEDDLPKVLAAVKKDNHLMMDIYDREDQTRIATGKLETLDNEINTATGTLKLRGVCSNEDESLFPNQFVNVHLLVNTLRDITLVPNSAIQRNSESAYVYLVKSSENDQTNKTVQIQTITVGTTDGTNSVVNELSPGAVIASDNFNRLTDGAKVSVRPTGGQEAEQGQPKAHHKHDSQ
jgi:membrane fusion protein, multidrug efflux system